MLRFLTLAAVVLAVAACDSATDSATSGPAASTSSTTTTIESDTCDRVGADTVSFLDSLIRVLDATRLAEFKERGEWPDDLKDLERASRDLDFRVAALNCDPAAIQQRALDEANLIPGSPLSEGLIAMLLTPPTTSTTTEASDTTNGSMAETSDGDASSSSMGS